MAIPTEFFRWWIIDERTGKRRRTTYKLSRENAARQFPGCEPDLSSREIRMLPGPGEWSGNAKPLTAQQSPAPSEPKLSSCAFCAGSGWVCADHPGLPWQHDGCGAEGAPCVCNPSGAVQWRKIIAEAPNDEPRQ